MGFLQHTLAVSPGDTVSELAPEPGTCLRSELASPLLAMFGVYSTTCVVLGVYAPVM